MGFALVFVLFFSLDILLVTGFSSFGLAPVMYLSAGAALYTAWFLLRHRRTGWRMAADARVFWMFCAVIVTVLLSNFLRASISLFVFFIRKEWRLLLYVNDFLDILALFASAALILLLVMRPRSPFLKWMAVSASLTVLKFGLVRLFDSLPRVIWLYGGVLDMAILFCWLVIIHRLLEREYDDGKPEPAALGIR